jgi:anti-sigma factor RsiW
VDDAMMSHRTAKMRSDMRSQPAATLYDPAEIRSRTAIMVPKLPPGWTVADVQLFPSQYGPSVELAVRTGEFGDLSLFAVRPGGFAVQPVAMALRGDVNAAYWQIGDVAYALVGGADGPALGRAAEEVSRLIY